MHNAPSVSYPVGRCVLAHRIFVSLTVITMLAWLSWGWQQGIHAVWSLAGCLGAAAGVIGWRSLNAQGGTLTWDGQVWCWHDAPMHEDAIGHAQLVLDWQHTLLLRWQPSDGTTSFQTVNLWLSAESAPDFWQDLRRAVLTHNHLG
jgi:toxin CptA